MGRTRVILAALLALGAPGWAGSLDGSLTDSGGAGVAGATVWLLVRVGSEETVTRRATTADDGAFTFALSSEAKRRALLVARVAGRGCVAEAVRLPSGRVDLRLQPGFELSGEVVDPDGRPLVGVSAQLTALESPWPEWPLPRELVSGPWSTVTDAGGTWRLSDVPRPSRRVVVRGAGTTVVKAEIGPAYQWSPACISVLRPAGELSGRLLRADGSPATGELLMAAGEEARCDSQGRFLFQHVPTGLDVQVSSASTCSCGSSAGSALGTGRVGRPMRTLHLPRMGRLSGVVTRSSGQPAADVEIAFYGADHSTHARTDAAGRYEMEVWPGAGSLYVPGSHGSSRQAEIKVLAGQTVTAPKLSAQLPTRRLRVVDSAGQPVAKATVWVSSGGSDGPLTTDESGRLAIENNYWSEDDAFSVVTKEPFAAADGKLPPDADEVTFKLAAVPLAEQGTGGVVVDDAGQPVPGAKVTLGLMAHRPRYFSMNGVLTLTTDETGRWRAGALPAKWTVLGRVTAAEHRGRRLQMTSGGDQKTVLERRDAVVSGAVVDAAGRPAAGALVYAEGCLGDRPAVSDAAGRFTCTGLPHRRATIVAQRGRCDLARAESEVPGEGLRLTLAPAPTPFWRAEPTKDEEALARQIIDAALAESEDFRSGQWLGLLAAGEPGDALDRVLRLPAKQIPEALTWLLGATPAGVYYDERLVRVVRDMPNEWMRREAVTAASDHLPPARRDLHGQLLTIAREAIKGMNSHYRTAMMQPVEDAAILAKLALRAGGPAKAELAALVDAYRRSLAGRRDGSVTYYGGFPVSLVDALTPYYPDFEVLLEARCSALCNLFAVSPETAWATARRWWPGPNGQPAWPWKVEVDSSARDRLAAVVVRQTLARYGADGVARLPNLGYEQALNCALAAEDPAVGRRLAAMAEARLPAERQSATARLALVVGFEPAVAERARRRALGEWSFDPYSHEDFADAAEAMGNGTMNVAYGLALIEPNRSRWLAEAVYSGGAPNGGELTQAVLTMAAADPQRALRMAREQGLEGNEARELARWLLSDRGVRALFFLGSGSGSITTFG